MRSLPGALGAVLLAALLTIGAPVTDTPVASAAPPPPAGTPYWPGWDIARDVVFVPGSTTAGYVLDGWGGVHRFGSAPALAGGRPYWRGWDIARKLVLDPAVPTRGWILDGWGGAHRFGGAPALGGTPYWRGWDIARALTLRPGSSTAGHVLDAFGGIHAFGGAPALGGTPYWPGQDRARDLAFADGTTHGWVLDTFGNLFGFAGAPPVVSAAEWPGFRIARALGTPTAAAAYTLDGWGGLHGFDPRQPALTRTSFVTGLDHPWDFAFTPIEDRIVLTERAEGIAVAPAAGGAHTLLHKPTDLVASGEGGMLGLALDPSFASNRRLYVCFASTLGGSNNVRVARLVVNGDYTGITNRADIVTGLPYSSGRHSGCRLRFRGGHLWVATGDAAIGSTPQSRTVLGGKVLRITTDGAPVLGNMGPPFDPRVVNYGHRNLQGLAFRSDGKLFTVEHGPDRNDEINVSVFGGNYGWDPVPGYNESVPMTDFAKFPGAIGPIWRSGDGGTIAPSGATFLTGAAWKGWENQLAVAVLKGRKLMVVGITAAGHVTRTVDAPGLGGTRLRTPVRGPDGALYLTTDDGAPGGAIWRVAPS
jgi:glucose/arabinose dehydrogenase